MMPRIHCPHCEQMVVEDDVHSCYDAALHRRVVEAERAVVDAAISAEYPLNQIALAEAHYGGQLPDGVFALLDAITTLRRLTS